MNDIVIRRGRAADLPYVVVLAGNSKSAAHWQPEHYHSALEPGRVLLVAERDGGVLGFVVGHDIAGEWELENVVVAPGYQRHGIGKKLVEALVEESEKSNAKFIFLEVRESNVAAKCLYERCGFQQYGRRSGYYSGPVEDAILYRFLCNPKSLEKC